MMASQYSRSLLAVTSVVIGGISMLVDRGSYIVGAVVHFLADRVGAQTRQFMHFINLGKAPRNVSVGDSFYLLIHAHLLLTCFNLPPRPPPRKG